MQERIHQFLMSYNYEEILKSFEEEKLIFISGALYGMGSPKDRYTPIIRFSLSEKSIFDIDYQPPFLDKHFFHKPLSQVENDENKFFHVSWGADQSNLIKRDYEGLCKWEIENIFINHNEIIEILAQTNEVECEDLRGNRILEEINQEVINGYKFRIRLGRFGYFGFCTKSTDLINDDIFHNWLIHFSNKYCEHEILKENLQKDFWNELKNIPKITEDNTEEERSKRDMARYYETIRENKANKKEND